MMKTGVWGFEIRFEGRDWEWAAPSLLMARDGMCDAERVTAVRSPFSGRIYTPEEFYDKYGPAARD